MKRCPFCAEEIQDAAVKCRYCGSVVGGAAAHPSGSSTTKPGSHGAPPPGPIDADARLLFEGPATWRSMPGAHFAAIASIVVGAVGAIVAKVVVVGDPTIWLIVGASLATFGALWLLGLRILRGSRRTRITTHTIDIETGVFGKSIHTIQLWRVRDVDFEQTFLERIAGVARIQILSVDAEQPRVVLTGLPGARQLFLDLRDAIAIARQSKNVVGLVS